MASVMIERDVGRATDATAGEGPGASDMRVVVVERPGLVRAGLEQAISGRPLTGEQREALRGMLAQVA